MCYDPSHACEGIHSHGHELDPWYKSEQARWAAARRGALKESPALFERGTERARVGMWTQASEAIERAYIARFGPTPVQRRDPHLSPTRIPTT